LVVVVVVEDDEGNTDGLGVVLVVVRSVVVAAAAGAGAAWCVSTQPASKAAPVRMAALARMRTADLVVGMACLLEAAGFRTRGATGFDDRRRAGIGGLYRGVVVVVVLVVVELSTGGITVQSRRQELSCEPSGKVVLLVDVVLVPPAPMLCV
jgi:hypothetical protein